MSDNIGIADIAGGGTVAQQQLAVLLSQPSTSSSAPASDVGVTSDLTLKAVYDLADAAAATSSAADAASTSQPSGGWLSPLSDSLELVLKTIQDKLDILHVPYAYGWSIILLTLFVKLITTPLTKKQVRRTLGHSHATGASLLKIEHLLYFVRKR